MSEETPNPKYKIGDIVVVNRKSGTEHKAAQAKIVKALYNQQGNEQWYYYVEIFSLRTGRPEVDSQAYSETEIISRA